MDKKELLKHIQSLASQQAITKDEVTSAFDAGIALVKNKIYLSE